MALVWSDYIVEEPEIVETGQLAFNVIVTNFESKKKQLALKSATPEQHWTLKWKILEDELLHSIFQFYLAHSGILTSFYWLHPYEKTILTEAGGSATHVHVARTLNCMAGDTICIDGTDYTISTVDDANKIINLTEACSKVDASTVQLKYLVRFTSDLSYSTLKAWLYGVGLIFERVI